MRPRVFPAEDLQVLLLPVEAGAASMRPRVFPAEDPGGLCSMPDTLQQLQ